MNHSGTVAAMAPARNTSGSTNGLNVMIRSVHTTMSGTTGVKSHRTRTVIHSRRRTSPFSRRWRALALAYPPTRKKIGIT